MSAYIKSDHIAGPVAGGEKHLAGETDARIECPLNKPDCPVMEALLRSRNECRVLQELSRTDSLTGYFNFRHFSEALAGEMERTSRTGLPTGLIMIDLDHFKRVNDTYGHETGNDVLRWSSDIFRDNIRRLDIPCRYGGEEFAIILPGTPLAGAVHVAKRLQSELLHQPFRKDGISPLPLTASFGVDVYTGRPGESPKEFIHRTDRLLLEAKEKGRNRICFNQSSMKTAASEVSREERDALGISRRSNGNQTG
ncbi:MAG: GGDEF domain-containing protein [Thermodesulfobacteriota bacterium]